MWYQSAGSQNVVALGLSECASCREIRAWLRRPVDAWLEVACGGLRWLKLGACIGRTTVCTEAASWLFLVHSL